MTVTRAQVQGLRPELDVVRLTGYGPHRVTVEGPIVELDRAYWIGDVVRLELRDGDVPALVAAAELVVIRPAAVSP